MNEFETAAYEICPHCNTAAVKSLYAAWKKNPSLQPKEYLLDTMIKDNEILVKDCLPSEMSDDGQAIFHAERWFKSRKIMVRLTMEGACILKKDAEAFIDFLERAKPIQPVFTAFCMGYAIPAEPRAYASFLLSVSRDDAIVKCRYHPFCNAMEYYLCADEQLRFKLDDWAIAYTSDMESIDPECLSIKDAAELLKVNQCVMLSWAKGHRDAVKYVKGRLLIPRPILMKLSDNWRLIRQLEPIITAATERIPDRFRSEVRKSVFESIRNGGFPWYVQESTYPQQEKGKHYYTGSTNVQIDVNELIKTLCVYPLVSIKNELNLSTDALKEKACNGIISAELREGKYYISENEITRLRKVASAFVTLDSVVVKLMDGNDIQFRLRNANHRVELISYLERNGYEDMLISDAEEPVGGGYFGLLIPNEARQALEQKLFLWLVCFNKRPEHVVETMLQHFAEQYPKTVSSLKLFINTKKDQKDISDSCIVDLLDIVFSSIECELCEMPEADIDDSIIEPNKNRTIASCTLLAEYLYKSGYTKRQYQFAGTGYKMQCEAYGIVDAAKIVAACCNSEIWDSYGLIAKAVANKRFADMWLFFSLHVYSAWRSTDYVRLPAPRLRYSPQETLERIQTNNYPLEAAKYVADFFVARIQMAGRTPHKTQRYPNVPELPFFCPESCREPFGIILSIAAAHYYLNDSCGTFVQVVTDVPTMRNFYGHEIVKACGGSRFSGRRMNKSMMQADRYEAEEGEGYSAQIAYLMASTMRAHKGGYAQIPETTRIYLQDANFAGLTAAEAARLMFERGTCSFFVAKLFEMCYGEQYTRLPEFKKTEVIKFLKVTPYKSKRVLECIHNAEDEVAEIIQTMVQEGNDPKTMLERILSCSARGKGTDENCIWKACNSRCREPERIRCFGCRYEVKSKQMLVKLMAEMARLEYADGDSLEREKNQWLQSNVIYPAAAEIIQELRKMTSDEDISDYLEIYMEVKKEYGCSDQEAV